MKLKEYIEALNEFVIKNPDALEFDVITSNDDEGNGYHHVYYTPTKGIFDKGDFIPEKSIEDFERNVSEMNIVCLN